MRRFIALFIVLLISVFTFSCQKDGSKTNGSNKLVGTKWYATYSNYLMVLEFTSNIEVTGYFANDNGVYYKGRTSGTYKVSGNTVTFYDFRYRWSYAYYKLESASVSGSLLSVTGQSTINIDNDEWRPWTETFSKQ